MGLNDVWSLMIFGSFLNLCAILDPVLISTLSHLDLAKLDQNSVILTHFEMGRGKIPPYFGGMNINKSQRFWENFPGFSPIAIWEWISSMWKNMTCHVLVKVSAISLPREVAPVKRFRRSAWWHKPQRKSTTLWTGFDVDVRIGWRLGLW